MYRFGTEIPVLRTDLGLPAERQHLVAVSAPMTGLHIHPAAPKDNDHPESLVVHADGTVKFVAGEVWHSDVSCA